MSPTKVHIVITAPGFSGGDKKKGDDISIILFEPAFGGTSAIGQVVRTGRLGMSVNRREKKSQGGTKA